MLMPRPLRSMAILTIVMLLLGASAAWSIENRQSRVGQGPARAIVSGLQGEALAFPNEPSKGAAFLRFHDVIAFGDQFATGPGSMTEVLVGRQTLVTVYEESRVRFLEETPGQTVVQVMKGDVRIAAARSDQAVVIRVPGATALTYGALVRVNVLPSTRPATADRYDNGAHPMRTAVAMASEGASGESFQVIEGLVQLQSSAPENPSLTLKAGQSVRILAGRIEGSLANTFQPAPPPLPATDAHASTALRAVQHVVAREQAHAEALQRALLEGVTEAVEPQADFRNVIISTSFDVQLVNVPSGQSSQQGSFNTPAPAVIGSTASTPSVPQPVQPLPSGVMVGIPSTSQPAFPSPTASGSASPFIPPSIQPSPGSVGSVGGPSISPPVPQSIPQPPPPSLPNLLGTLDILQLDKGRAFKDKPDKPSHGPSR